MGQALGADVLLFCFRPCQGHTLEGPWVPIEASNRLLKSIQQLNKSQYMHTLHNGNGFDDWALLVSFPRRKELVNGEEAYPIGLWINAWNAGYVMAEVVEILIQAPAAADGRSHAGCGSTPADAAGVRSAGFCRARCWDERPRGATVLHVPDVHGTGIFTHIGGG